MKPFTQLTSRNRDGVCNRDRGRGVPWRPQAQHCPPRGPPGDGGPQHTAESGSTLTTRHAFPPADAEAPSHQHFPEGPGRASPCRAAHLGSVTASNGHTVRIMGKFLTRRVLKWHSVNVNSGCERTLPTKVSVLTGGVHNQDTPQNFKTSACGRALLSPGGHCD